MKIPTYSDTSPVPKDSIISNGILGGVASNLEAFVIAQYMEQLPVLYVAINEAQLSHVYDMLKFMDPSFEVVILPPWDCLPYDRISPKSDIMAARMESLAKINGSDKLCVLTTASAILQKLVPPDQILQATQPIRVQSEIDLSLLTEELITIGYNRVGTVREPGEFVVRGGLFDIFPVNSRFPLRIDLFGDEVESIKSFDPIDQRTLEDVDSFQIQAVGEINFSTQSCQIFCRNWRDTFGAQSMSDPIYQSIQAGRMFPGQEHWLPMFFDKPLSDVFAYINPKWQILVDHQVKAAIKERHDIIADYYKTRLINLNTDETSYRPIKPDALYLSSEEVENNFLNFNLVTLTPMLQENSPDFKGRSAISFPSTSSENPYNLLLERAQDYLDRKMKVVLACYSEGSRARISGILEDHGGKISLVESLSEVTTKSLCLAVIDIERGFTTDDLVLITEQDLLGERLVRPRKRKINADLFISEVSSLTPGDLVVHEEHGLGRFESLQTLEVSGTAHDCVCVMYSNNDKLFIPVENLEILSRYGSDRDSILLDKLGGAAWQARKARIKEKIRQIADSLIKVAAERKLRKGQVLEKSAGIFDEFCASFPYVETEDQARAIEQALQDLASGQPMDRLICGDVGYGKTEVAIRTAFVAAQQGLQVAVIAPTTLLCRQHFLNFNNRFSGFGIRVAQLSRLVSAKQKSEIKSGLAKGEINVVIGTHALLAKDIKFLNLSLVIIDEEQRFGVEQKEKLKQLKSEVHVMTLTATPIPRTLQMALNGVRDMSLITTPPIDRLAVRTFVMPYDSVTIREAILREYHRGGQCFYVCPRISDLDQVREQLIELIPEIKIVTAHGQMSASALEDVMLEFDKRHYDMLLATNIIESGIDIPNANTLVVHRSDHFGLAQLYQLRGRVGRSKQRGYAYFTLPPEKVLSENAMRRLGVLQTLDSLGAGFQLASHDLDIRGAGNILGDEQSGHIKEVGVELYQQMLNEAIAGHNTPVNEDEVRLWTPQINIGIAVLIPETYVYDFNLRMSLYQRASSLECKEELDSFAVELIDRFGPLPAEVLNLLYVIELKILCRKAGVERVDAGAKGVLITLYKNQFTNPIALVEYIASQKGSASVRGDQRLSLIRPWSDIHVRIQGLKQILSEIVELNCTKS